MQIQASWANHSLSHEFSSILFIIPPLQVLLLLPVLLLSPKAPNPPPSLLLLSPKAPNPPSSLLLFSSFSWNTRHKFLLYSHLHFPLITVRFVPYFCKLMSKDSIFFNHFVYIMLYNFVRNFIWCFFSFFFFLAKLRSPSNQLIRKGYDMISIDNYTIHTTHNTLK